AMVYWVANETIYATPFLMFTGNGTFTPTWSYAVGSNPTQPVLGRLKDGTNIIITTGGDFVYVFRLPLDMNPFTFNVSLMIADHQQIQGVAYQEGWIVGDTRFGKVYGLEVTRSTLLPKWLFDAGMGESHGVASIYHDKAY